MENFFSTGFPQGLWKTIRVYPYNTSYLGHLSSPYVPLYDLSTTRSELDRSDSLPPGPIRLLKPAIDVNPPVPVLEVSYEGLTALCQVGVCHFFYCPRSVDKSEVL